MEITGKYRICISPNRPVSRFVSAVFSLLVVICVLGLVAGGRSYAQGCAGCPNTACAAGQVKPCTETTKFRVPEPLRDLGKMHKVRLVYFIPTNREPTKHYRQKITTVITIMADVYRQSLQGQGYETEGLDFYFEDGKPKVHLLRGRFSAAYYSGWPEYEFLTTWKRVLPEVQAAYGSARQNLYIIFVESYDEAPSKYEWPGGVALGARYSADGGVGMFSSWILRDEFCATRIQDQIRYLTDDIPIVGRTALGHGRKDSPRFEFIEDGFGAVVHELGHAFGLPHDKRNEREYIMGNGFRHLRHNYLPALEQRPIRFSPENTLILAYSRFLTAELNLEDNRQPVIQVEAPSRLKASDKEITITLDFRDDNKLGGYVVFAKHQDSVIGGGNLEGNSWEQKQTFSLRGLTAGKTCQLNILLIDRGGNLATKTVIIPVEK
jgi:putative peptidase family protein